MQPHKNSSSPLEMSNLRPPASGLRSLIPALVGVIGLVAAVWLGLSDARQFWHSYLVAIFYFLTLGLGGLFFVMLQFVTRAGWSVVVRRLAEHVMGVLPLLALLTVPLAFGVHDLYEWSHAEEVAHDSILEHKSPYLNTGFFYVRSAIYLAIWSLLGWWFRRESLLQDDSADPAITRKLQTASAPGLILFALTLTFASFDWIMSLTPHWYSTVFGVYIFAGSCLGILAFLIILALSARGGDLVPQHIITYEHLHDLGKLLFGFVVFWAYIGFSQFMLIWYGNLPEETIWYAHRLVPGWYALTIFLAVGHFVLPFFFLLPVSVKRRKMTLYAAAGWLLAMHYLDLYWIVMPTLHPEGFSPHLLDLATFVGIGGFFLVGVSFLMRGPALVPIRDPRLAESLSFENM